MLQEGKKKKRRKKKKRLGLKVGGGLGEIAERGEISCVLIVEKARGTGGDTQTSFAKGKEEQSLRRK